MVTPTGTTDDVQEPRESTPDTSVPGKPATATGPTDHADPERQPRRRFRYTLPGAWVAVAFACLSFTPSLVPRPGAFQGVVCGISAAIGYGLGVTRRPRLAGVRQSAGTPDPAPIVAGVPDRRSDHRADFLRARAALAGADPGPDGRRTRGVRVETVVAGGGGAAVRRTGRGSPGHPALLLVGRAPAEPVDGTTTRAGPGLGAGRGADGGPAQRSAGGRNPRHHRPDLRGEGHRHQR